MQELDFAIQRKILKAGNRLSSIRSDHLGAHNLTTGQSETLLFFSSRPGSTVSDLKDHLEISHQAARNIVGRLKEKGLLSAEPSQKDARANAVRLTAAGSALCDHLKQSGSQVGTTLLCGFTEDEKDLLLHFLERVTENIMGSHTLAEP